MTERADLLSELVQTSMWKAFLGEVNDRLANLKAKAIQPAASLPEDLYDREFVAHRHDELVRLVTHVENVARQARRQHET